MVKSKSQSDIIKILNNRQQALKYFKEYLHKYVKLLQGMVPDTSKDTSLFIRGLEKEHIDIQQMLEFCSIENIEESITSIFLKILPGCKKLDSVLIRFRRELIRWLKKELEKWNQ